MKYSYAIIFLILFSNTLAYGKTMYVSGVMEVTLRSGPGTDHKVISMVKSGQTLKVLEPGKSWTKVQIQNGRTGWILTRFVTDQMPKTFLLEQLVKKHDALEQEFQEIKQNNESFIKDNKFLKQELMQTQSKLKEITKAYKALKQKSANFFQLETKYKEAKSELENQVKKSSYLENQLMSKNIKWFGLGAGVLLMGIIIGYSARRQRRQSSLL